ncbi:transmembrane protein, putative, partial [Rhizoctonia solani AG-3 Rhs1AP]
MFAVAVSSLVTIITTVFAAAALSVSASISTAATSVSAAITSAFAAIIATPIVPATAISGIADASNTPMPAPPKLARYRC